MSRSSYLAFALLSVVSFPLACSSENLDVGSSVPTPGSGGPEQCEAPGNEVERVVEEVDRTILNFAVDAEYTYYLSEPSLPSSVSTEPRDDSPATVLKRVSRRGDAAPEELARSFSTLQSRSTFMERGVGIARVGDWVYWSATRDDGSGDALFRVDKNGGDKQRVTGDSDNPSGSLVVDGAQNLYFTNRGEGRPRLVRIAPDGTRKVIVAEGSDDIASFAVDDREVFWTALPRLGDAGFESDALVQATPLDGGAARTLYGPIPDADIRIRAVSTAGVYFTHTVGDVVEGALLLPKSGGEPTPIVSDSSVELLLVDGGDVVWTSPNEVRRRRAGEPSFETLAYDVTGVSRLRVSACDVYWNESMVGGSQGAAIYRRSR
jgi:hypothetical protein